MRQARRAATTFLMVAVLCGAAVAQDGGATFTSDMLTDFNRAGQKLTALAEAAPAEKYGWAPSNEVRTLAEVYMHVVGTNLLLPSALGAPMPEGIEMPEGGPMAFLQQLETQYTGKDEVLEQLEKSFEYATGAIPAITDLETEVTAFGFPATKRAYLLILLTHAHEHLGQAIAYSRSVGVVPPWSRPAEGDGGR